MIIELVVVSLCYRLVGPTWKLSSAFCVTYQNQNGRTSSGKNALRDFNLHCTDVGKRKREYPPIYSRNKAEWPGEEMLLWFTREKFTIRNEDLSSNNLFLFVHFSLSYLSINICLKLILSKLPREDVVSYFSTLPLNDNVVKQLSRDYWIYTKWFWFVLYNFWKLSWQIVEFIIFVFRLNITTIDYHRLEKNI